MLFRVSSEQSTFSIHTLSSNDMHNMLAAIAQYHPNVLHFALFGGKVPSFCMKDEPCLLLFLKNDPLLKTKFL